MGKSKIDIFEGTNKIAIFEETESKIDIFESTRTAESPITPTITPPVDDAKTTLPPLPSISDSAGRIEEEAAVSYPYENTASVASSSRPSWYQAMIDIVSAPFEAYGQGVIDESQAKVASSKQLVETISYLNKPIDSVKVGMKRAIEIGEFRRPRTEQLGILKKGFWTVPGQIQNVKAAGKDIKFDANYIVDGLIDGWNGEEYWSPADLVNQAVIGTERTERMNDFINDHWYLAIPKTGVDFASEFVLDAFVDTALLTAAGKVTKTLPIALRAASKSDKAAGIMAKRIPKTYANAVFDKVKLPPVKGHVFGDWMDDVVNLNTRHRNVDDMLRWQLTKGSDDAINLTGDIAMGRPTKKYPRGKPSLIDPRDKIWVSRSGTSGPMLKQAKTVIDENVVLSRHIDNVSKVNRIRLKQVDADLPRVRQVMRNMDDIADDILPAGARETAHIDYDNLLLEQKHLVDCGKRNASVKRSLTLMSKSIKNGSYYDYMASSRVIRQKYLENVYKITDAPGRKRVNEIIDTLTLGRLKDTSGKGFAKGVGQGWKKMELLSDDELGTLFDMMNFYENPIKATKSTWRFMPFKDDFTPIWAWYKRKGVPIIGQLFESADFENTRRVKRLTDLWQDQVKIVGDDDLTQKLVYHLAEGDPDNAAHKLIKYHNIPDAKVEKLREAARVANTITDELADDLVKLNLWPVDKSGKPLPRYKNYAYHQVKLEAMKEHPDPYLIAKMVQQYEHATNTKISISMLKHRLKHDLPLAYNANASTMSAIHMESYKIHWEPTYKQARQYAKLTGDHQIIKRTDDVIKFTLRGEITPFEARLEPKFQALSKRIDAIDNWLPGKKHWQIQERETKRFLNAWRRGVYGGAMSYRPGPALRNLTQSTFPIAITGYKDFFSGQQSLWTQNGRAFVKDNCRLLVNRTPMEGFDMGMLSRIEQTGMWGFRKVDEIPNVQGTFNSTFYHRVARNKDKLDIVRKYGDFGNPRLDVDGFFKAANRAVRHGQLGNEVTYANLATKTFQYGYRPYDMPHAMSGVVGKTVFQFGTWPSNYFYNVLPTLADGALYGKGIAGESLSIRQRMGMFRHWLNGQAIIAGGAALGIDATRHAAPGPTLRPTQEGLTGGAVPLTIGGAFPMSIASPGVQLLSGTVQALFAMSAGRGTKAARYELQKALPMLPPLIIRDIMKSIESNDITPMFGRPLQKKVADKKKKNVLGGILKGVSGLKAPTMKW